MVSQVLAQAILNQKAPDIAGSFREGQEIARGRKTKELTSKVLSGQGGLDELIEINPEVALALGETIRARSAKDINDFVRDAKITQGLLQRGGSQKAAQFVQQRRNAIAMRGGDTSQTDEILGLLSSGRDKDAQDYVTAFTSALDQAKDRPAALIEQEALLKQIKSEDPDAARAARIALKLEAPAKAGLSVDEQIDLTRKKALARAEVELDTAGDIERLKASQKATGKGISERQQGFIDSGVSAADSTANIRRSIALLDEVKTGGFASISAKAKQMFGVESANEGELAANLGQAVLAQLKPLFGAAFTAAEGERLESISARFGSNTETNRRLLGQMLKISEKAAMRAIRAAESSGDDFTAKEIKDSLEFVLDDSVPSGDSLDVPKRLKFNPQTGRLE